MLISTLNCEGLRRFKDYIRTYLDNNSCDILALQERWHLDNNIDCFSTIHDNYMYTAISGVDASKKMLCSSRGVVANAQDSERVG